MLDEDRQGRSQDRIKETDKLLALWTITVMIVIFLTALVVVTFD